MSKAENRAFCRENTLLIVSLTNSREPVGVYTSKGTRMWPPAMVICVLLGSSFSGRYSHTTLVWQISFRFSNGISFKRMTLKVPDPLILCFLVPKVPLPIPWPNLLNSLEYEVSHLSFILGCCRSCLCSKILPNSPSKIGRDSRTGGAGVHHKSRRSLRYLRFAAWDGCTVKARDWVQWATGC